MNHDPDKDLGDEDRLQRLFDETAAMPTTDELERLEAHARGLARKRPARSARLDWTAWLRWPVLVPAAAAIAVLGLLAGRAFWPGPGPEPMAASTRAPEPSHEPAGAPVPSGPDQVATEPETAGLPDFHDEPDDPMAASDSFGDDDDWAGEDELDLLHPPQTGGAQESWLAVVEADLAGGG